MKNSLLILHIIHIIHTELENHSWEQLTQMLLTVI